MRFSRLAAALNPIGTLARINRKLDRRAKFDEALSKSLLQMFGTLNARLDAMDRRQERMWGHLDFMRGRLNTYVGDGVALAYTIDGMPIFVNAQDIGCPAALLNGGRYEEDNHQVLLSFADPATVFLDIGAADRATTVIGRTHICVRTASGALQNSAQQCLQPVDGQNGYLCSDGAIGPQRNG